MWTKAKTPMAIFYFIELFRKIIEIVDIYAFYELLGL
jgi:hypothetical protein